MAEGKKGIDKSIFVVVIMGIAGIAWMLYTGQRAAPPLPPTPMTTVFNAKYDDSVWQVADWLKKHVANPASLKITHWGKVQSLGDGYAVSVKYQEKNAAGAEMAFAKVFDLDHAGNIIGVVDDHSQSN